MGLSGCGTMNLEQALRSDVELVRLICTSGSTEEVLDYCKERGVSISVSDLREGFKIEDDIRDDQLMVEIQKYIERELARRSEYSEDEELENVSGGFALTVFLACAAIGGVAKIATEALDNRGQKKADERAHKYDMELIDKKADADIRVMNAKADLGL